MSGLECVRAGALLSSRLTGLSDADRLRLEEHLERCGECRDDAVLLEGIRSIADGEMRPLSPAARERAVQAALAASSQMPSNRPSRRRWAAAAGGLSVAAAAALVLLWTAGQPTPRPSASFAEEGQAAGAWVEVGTRADRVIRGEVRIGDAAATEGSAVAAGALVRADQGAVLALGHGRVELAPGSEVRWDAEHTALKLLRGRVSAEVDPRAHARFAVETERFAVLVLGTRFEVSLQDVTVHEGRVRVLSRSGEVLVGELGAGGHWRLGAPKPAPEPEVVEPEAQPEPEPVRPAAKAATPRAHARDVAAELARVRRTLAAGDTGGARSELATLMAGRLSRSQRAEALSLRAECAQVEGDLESAITDYLRVARRYSKRAAGDNALFAAAQLERDRGRPQAARKLFERYLARYPEGRFVREARARLEQLAR